MMRHFDSWILVVNNPLSESKISCRYYDIFSISKTWQPWYHGSGEVNSTVAFKFAYNSKAWILFEIAIRISVI